MRIFTCTDHDTFYPVGAASVVIADDEEMARRLLDSALIARGLKPSSESSYTINEILETAPCAVILVDGNY